VPTLRPDHAGWRTTDPSAWMSTEEGSIASRHERACTVRGRYRFARCRRFRGLSGARGRRRSRHRARRLAVRRAKQADLGVVVEGLDAHVQHDACDRGVGERRRAAVTFRLRQPGVTERSDPAAKSASTRRARADAARPGGSRRSRDPRGVHQSKSRWWKRTIDQVPKAPRDRGHRRRLRVGP
jgi:hypothetical protein